MSKYINQLREYKFLGLATFDLVGSIAVSSFIGSTLGFNPIFSGLISIPASVAIHIVVGTDTILTEFVKSDSPHKYHGLAIGTGIGLISKLVLGISDINSINIGLGIGILSTLYMRVYGHDLPQKIEMEQFEYYVENDPNCAE